MTDTPIGKITHFWPKAGAAAVELQAPLTVGDRIRIRGHGHEIVQEVTSLEVGHHRKNVVGPGEDAAVHVDARVHEGDEVLRIEPEVHWSVASGSF
ncbi:MAG TPA: translation elongation factor-like protein [Candidatus Thermoplasmatota archaeon]|nr:translation elongation factor-like protein [Candidatus Thermoplasmatota archaeon]